MGRGENFQVPRRFLLASLPWVFGAGVLWLLTMWALSSVTVAILYAAVATVSVLLVLSAFAGGIGVSSSIQTTGQVMTFVASALAYGSVAYVGLAYIAPLAEFAQTAPSTVADRFPFGPETPSTLIALRDFVTENPSESPVFGSTSVLNSSPSFFEKQLQDPRIMGVLAVVLSCLGFSVGILTENLAHGARHRVRWAVGLGFAFSVFAADRLVLSSLRANPVGSGVVRSWLVLVVPLGLLVVLGPLAWKRNRG